MRIALPFPRSRGDRPDAPRVAQGKRPRGQRLGLLLAGLVLLLAGSLYAWRAQATPSAPSISVPVTVGDLAVQIESSGNIQPARAVDLAFQTTGQIKEVLVEPGDLVQAGQALARLDDLDLRMQVQQAEADLKTAEARLNKATNGEATPLDLAAAQSKLQAAEAQLQKTRTGERTPADLRQAVASLQAARARLDALKNPTPDKLSAAQLQLRQARTTLTTASDSLSSAKTGAEHELARATQSLRQAQASYSTALQNWQSVQETGRDPYNPTMTDASGKAKPNKLNDAERQRYYEAFVQAEAALHSAESAVAQAQVNFDTARQKEASEVPQAEATVEDAQRQLDALLHPSQASLAGAEAEVASAQAQLDKLRQGGSAADISAAQAQVEQARIDLERLSAPAAASEIAAAEAGVAQARADLDAAKTDLAQATLTAPFAGTVATVNMTAGGLAGSTATVELVDTSALHVDINLSEIDLPKVKPGQPATITFEALPDTTLTGTVESIAPTATSGQSVVSYLIRVRFEPGTADVRVGMSADVSVEVERHAGVVQAPSRAITSNGPVKTVQVLYGKQHTPVTIQVETGASNGAMTEIVKCVDTGKQCLRAGDQLAVNLPTDEAQGSSSGDKMQFFAAPAGGPPGGAGKQIIISGP
ncbi:MAG TPA: HlyD family efflux transporter periplasmic adaptor subunit [Roseiflexaceae bacterium]|nr:HlyD family efflux transporter periplasmic adaptor subunit [Roseiflexaceae bacterium]